MAGYVSQLLHRVYGVQRELCAMISYDSYRHARRSCTTMNNSVVSIARSVDARAHGIEFEDMRGYSAREMTVSGKFQGITIFKGDAYFRSCTYRRSTSVRTHDQSVDAEGAIIQYSTEHCDSSRLHGIQIQARQIQNQVSFVHRTTELRWRTICIGDARDVAKIEFV